MTLSRSLEKEIGNSGYGNAFGTMSWDLSEATPELQWPLSIYVYDRMRRQDSQCIAVKKSIAMPIVGAAWRVDPDGASDEVTRFVAENLGLRILGDDSKAPPARRRGRFSWIDHVRQALLALDYGHMPFEQVYEIVGSGAGARAWLKKLAPRMPATLWSIDVNSSGGLEGIHQGLATGRSQQIPVDRLVFYANEREGGNWTGLSIYRGAYKHWLLKDRLMRVGAITVERNGMGVPFFEAPAGAVDSDLAVLDRLAQGWRAGETSGGAVPAGTKIHLKGVDGTLPDSLPQIRWHSEEIAKSALAMFLNLGTTQTGARALGDAFIDFFQLSIDAVSQQIADTATMHVVEDLVDLNFGETEASPRIVVAPTEAETDASPDELVAMATAHLLTPDAMLEGYLRDKYRLPAADTATATVIPLSGPVAAARARAARRRPSVAAAADEEPARADPTTLPEPLGTIYQRRLDLEVEQNTQLLEPLTAFAEAVDLAPIVDLLEQVSASTAAPEPDPRIAEAELLAAEALTAAAAGESGQDLLDTAHEAFAHAWAEGHASARQLVSVTEGQIGVDLDAFEVDFAAAVEAARDLDELWAEVDTWFADHVGVTSRAVAAAVEDALTDGTLRSELVTILREVIGDGKKAAVLYDHAMALSLSEGALRLYTDDGLESLDVLTAGDSRVDAPCEQLEQDNPHPLAEAPSLPVHIGCRCALAPSDDAIRHLLHT